jgi:hypothetical protein
MARRSALAAAVALVLIAGCTPEKVDAASEQDRVDEAARAFERYVHRYYETRLAAERNTPGPSLAARIKAREDLKAALEKLGLDLPEGNALAGAFDAVRDLLVAHDYVFLPLTQAGETVDGELGVALAHVRRREAARSMTFWDRTIDYKLIVYEPLVYDYSTWRARTLKVEGPMYSPGRFSPERWTVYIDNDYCVKRAQAQPPETQTLGLDGIIHEVELRQAAYLLFSHEPGAASEGPRLHEKVLWTAVRYGDPDIAWKDVNGLATDARYPEELRAAAEKVRARLPVTLEGLKTKEERSRVLQAAAEAGWKALGS